MDVLFCGGLLPPPDGSGKAGAWGTEVGTPSETCGRESTGALSGTGGYVLEVIARDSFYLAGAGVSSIKAAHVSQRLWENSPKRYKSIVFCEKIRSRVFPASSSAVSMHLWLYRRKPLTFNLSIVNCQL